MASGALARARKGFGSLWTDSVWLELAISLIVGSLYVLVLLGPAMLNPRNVGWLQWGPRQLTSLVGSSFGRIHTGIGPSPTPTG